MEKSNTDNALNNYYRKNDMKWLVKDFVEQQVDLLNIEREEEEKQTLDNIYQFTARDLEKLGVCIRKLDLIETVFENYGKYLTHFQKRTTKDMGNKLGRYKFGNGDIVGLFEYSDKVHVDPLYKGVIVEFNEKKILVAFDEEIEAEKLPKNICLVQMCNQITYERIKEGLERLQGGEYPEETMSLTRVLFNVKYPTFRNEHEGEEKIEEKFEFYNKNLNSPQKEAVKFCLEANELALIHGPPGTGKTTTVVELILQSINQGLKILVVAPSNIAVDNLAEKLIPFRQKLNFDLCRIGHPARIMQVIQDISLDSKVERSSNMKFVKDVRRNIEKVRKELSKVDKRDKEKKNELRSQLRDLREDIKGSYRNTVIDIYSKSQVILATCVGAADFYLKESLKKHEGVFDLVVIDECAQATEAVCWISILLGKKLVLAGDHLQLPPTIKSKEAAKDLGYTLFDRMMSVYGERCSKLLNIQYRMNEAIMNFSSQELYKGKLKADTSVKDHKVTDLISNYSSDVDKLEILNKNLIYVDTNGFQFHESIDVDSSSKFNIGEAKICKFLVDYFRINEVPSSSIGIITPYSAQVNLLRHFLPVEDYKDLEVSTVDGFQGREKEIIVLSLVRSNKKREVGFLADNRRLNVAITRAKRMVAVVCDIGTVSNHPFLKKMCHYFNDKATPVELVDNIMDFKEIEDTKFESAKNAEKEEHIANSIQSIKKNDKPSGASKAVKKKKNKKKKEMDTYFTENKSEPLTSQPRNKNRKLSTDSQSNQKKDEVDLEFITKIKSLIEQFVNSNEDHYKIEGLSNAERKYIHMYAEIKGLIHVSEGEGENRILVLRKKNLNKQNVEKVNNNKINIEARPLIENTKNTEKSKNKNKNINNAQPEKIENKNEHIVGTNREVAKIKATVCVPVNKGKGIEDNWDEIDDLLESFQTEDKSKCNFENCTITSGISKCQFCNSYFCINHLRGVVHECVIYNKPDDQWQTKLIKGRLNQKVQQMEEKRNKKPPKKKK